MILIILSLLTIINFNFVYSQMNEKNIVFNLADLATDLKTADGTIHLEAFKTTLNDNLINSTSHHGQLRWVSIGYPKLVKINFNNTFYFTPEGFCIEVEMLNDLHREEFIKIVKQKYNINIKPNQIVSLVPALFVCSLEFYNGNEKLLINGKAENLNRMPIKIEFEALINQSTRLALEKRIKKEKDNLDLKLKCKISSTATKVFVNTLTITSQQINKMELIENLFGPANTTYVTREQMSSLSSKIYTDLNVVEDYEIPEKDFSEKFVNDLIKQTSN